MILYLQLLKALYGCLHSALIFYRKLLADLESIGFKLNLYNSCFVNKIVDGKQFTFTWHVENLKLSHIYKKVVDYIVEWMKGLYGQDMRMYRGKNHDCLGMVIVFSVRGQAAVTIVDYLKGVISNF